MTHGPWPRAHAQVPAMPWPAGLTALGIILALVLVAVRLAPYAARKLAARRTIRQIEQHLKNKARQAA